MFFQCAKNGTFHPLKWPIIKKMFPIKILGLLYLFRNYESGTIKLNQSSSDLEIS